MTYEPVNITAFDTTPVGQAATFAALGFKTMSLLILGISYAAGLATGLAAGKRKRSVVGQRNPFEEESLHLFLELAFEAISEIDEYDCLGFGMCEVMQLPDEEREEYQLSLNALGPKLGKPVPWIDFEKPWAKYQYATFIGAFSNDSTSIISHCPEIFSKCPLSKDCVLETMKNGSPGISCP